MPLTPIDVQQKTFGTALRGYDLDEVDDFLDEVVTSLQDYDVRLREAESRVVELSAELAERGDAEGAISRALVTAQQSADQIIAAARQQAEEILADARNRASELVAERDEQRTALMEEIASMRGAISGLREKLADLAAAVSDEMVAMDHAVEEAEGALVGMADEPVTGEEPAEVPLDVTVDVTDQAPEAEADWGVVAGEPAEAFPETLYSDGPLDEEVEADDLAVGASELDDVFVSAGEDLDEAEGASREAAEHETDDDVDEEEPAESMQPVPRPWEQG